jgi:hypothetical protein
MSPATSLTKPLGKPITQCPYCDHVSPAGTKFCGECGAALHLMPCPHCGAVNDITAATACYRCHGELSEKYSAAPAEPNSPQADISPYVVEPPARQRPHALVVGIVLLAFAAASYYAYRQRSVLDVRVPLPVAVEVKQPGVPADTNATAGNIIKAPAGVVPAPVAVPVAPAPAKPDPAAPRETAESAATIVATPDIVRARIDASKGLEKQAPYAGPCTDAVAALGLCTPESTPRRQ